MREQEKGYIVSCVYHEARHKCAAMPDDQGVHGPEVPMPPQPEAEPTFVTWMSEGKILAFHTLLHILKTGHHTMRNYYESEVKALRKLRDCSQSRYVDLRFFSLYQSTAEPMPRLFEQAQQYIERNRSQ